MRAVKLLEKISSMFESLANLIYRQHWFQKLILSKDSQVQRLLYLAVAVSAAQVLFHENSLPPKSFGNIFHALVDSVKRMTGCYNTVGKYQVSLSCENIEY